MSSEARRTICLDENCECAEPNCEHDCCALSRDQRRRDRIRSFTDSASYFPVGTPNHNRMVAMGKDGFDATSTSLNFNDTGEHSPLAMLSESFKSSQISRERDHKLDRLITSLPVLDKANSIDSAMAFLYRTQSEANPQDMELVFQAAIHKCIVLRFAKILREGARSLEGWKATCHAILVTIDKHYLASAKTALSASMTQWASEDPATYADRVVSRMDIYLYFAELNGKVVDESELSRAWVLGLDHVSRGLVSVSVNNMASYTIMDALGLARIAYDSSTQGARQQMPTLQQLAMPPGFPQVLPPGIGSTYPFPPMMPPPPEPPMASVQSMMDDTMSTWRQEMTAKTAALDARIAAMAPAPTVGQSSYNRYPCVASECNGAYHRYDDCPYKRPCMHCGKDGHHSARCWKRPGQTQPRFNNNRDRPRRDVPRFQQRGRSPDRGRDRGRPDNRPRDRSRSPARPRNDTKVQPMDSADKGGKRLNDGATE